MQVAVLGSGTVGQTLAVGLGKLGHRVTLGTREPDSPKVRDFLANAGPNASAGTFAEAAASGEMAFLATLGSGTRSALELAGPGNLAGKIVVDVTNPLQFGPDGPSVVLTEPLSGGESVQQWLPGARVVKALNTVPAALMTNAGLLGETPDMFICGNDAVAKQAVTGILQAWGWPVIDLGGIEQARLLEALTGLWVRYMLQTQNWQHAFKLVRKA